MSMTFWLFFCNFWGLTSSMILQNRRMSTTRLKFSPQDGLMLSTTDISSNGRTYQNLGMPRLLPPDQANDRGEWMMWLHARDHDFAKDVVNLSTGRILLATSEDGLTNWKLHQDSPVLNPNKENGGDWYFFDAEHVGLGDIIQPGNSALSKFAIDGRAFLMYIFGGCSDAVSLEGPKGPTLVKGIKMEIGVAVSQDGAHWSRIEGPEPYGSILTAGKTLHEFDGQFVGWPSVMEVGNEYRMYYSTYNAQTKRFMIGLAVAQDGLMNWKKRGPVFAGSNSDDGKFDGKGASRRHIVRLDDGMYRMWYEAISNDGVHSIGCATSLDGLVWDRLSDEPVFAASSDASAWDSGAVGSPNLIWLPDKRRWYGQIFNNPQYEVSS